MKKVFISAIILALLGGFAFVESSMGGNRCEPMLNFGGPNSPYCLTTLFNLPAILGALVAAGLSSGYDTAIPLIIIFSIISNFIFYLIAGSVILGIVRFFKK